MRKILLLVLLTFSLTTQASSNEVVKNISRQDFLSLVWNYEQNDTFKFEGTVPVIIDFYANWCNPCRLAAPILHEIAEEYKGKIIVYKVDVDVEEQLSSELGMQSLPSFLFIPTSGKPTLIQGIGSTRAETKKMLTDVLKSHLLKENQGE